MNWKIRVTLVGGFLGLLVGVASAFVYIRTIQSEQGDHEKVQLPALKPTDVLPIVITAVGLLRTIAGLGSRPE
ncbi:MAG: hypothetical protein M1434_02035 [Chloroflexi bacterium]|nr:hypothetical protein [Chloroflexota bacterium]MCL5273509.1 hypothetical protein [Chloroflexota bacterium]